MSENPNQKGFAPEQLPSLGRVVHYVDPKTGEHLAAIIAKVWAEHPTTGTAVNLRVLTGTDERVPLVTSVLCGEGPNTWHWPEYVAPAKNRHGL